MPGYNTRSSSKRLDEGGNSSPREKRRDPKSPNASGYSSSHSYRDSSNFLEDSDDHATDSQNEDEDEVDFSHESKSFSPSAATPSPRHVPNRRTGAGSSGSDTSSYSPPSVHRGPAKSPGSETGRLYQDLSKVTHRPKIRASPEKEYNTDKRTGKMSRADQGQRSSVHNNKLTIIAGIAIIVLLLLIFYPGDPEKNLKTPRSKSDDFKKFGSEIDKLRAVFKSQESRTWRSIKSSVKHILNGTHPEYPAVVMFAVRKDLDQIASCLARRVASIFNSITTHIPDDGYFDARLMTHLEFGKQKEDLDEKIHSHLKTGRSVVIDHLEALSPSASLLLHGTCDNDNAPFKDVFIGIVFYVDRDLKAIDVDTELTTYFKRELDMDKIGALLTRINNNAVVITEEKEFDFDQCKTDDIH